MQDSAFSEHLEQIRRGDRQRLEELLARWRPVIRLQARGMLGERFGARVDTSDVVQETMTQAFRDFLRFRGATEQEWAAWLRSILRGQAGKMRRFHSAQRRDVQREDAGVSSAGNSQCPLEQLIQAEQFARIAAALERLPQAMQDVLYLRVFLHQPFEQVAEAIGRSPGATRVLWTRAVQQLRAQLEGDSNGSHSEPQQQSE